ncbi:MAG: hypothetical protein ACLP4W_30030 [Mycobacterium sp.]
MTTRPAGGSYGVVLVVETSASAIPDWRARLAAVDARADDDD